MGAPGSVASAVRVRPEPLAAPAVGQADDDEPAPRATATSAVGRRARRSPARRATPSARWIASDALASSRLASRPPAPVLAPASCSARAAARASQAPELDRRPVVLGPENGTSTGPGARAPGADEHRHVARRLVEQREQARVLQQAARRVDDEQVGVLLGRQPREVRARGSSR